MAAEARGIRIALAVALTLSSIALMGLDVGVDFPFDRAYGTYENIELEALPVQSGALDLRLSSPENMVTLESGHLRLEPAEDGLHKASVQVIFSGEGQLITEVRVGSIPSRFEDRVRFPRQQRNLTAWVTIEAVEEGYRVVTQQLPETVQIEIESERGADLVSLCKRMSLFLAGDVGCERLESMLSSPRVPLPKPGSDYLVRRSDLTVTERERLDLYLLGSKL
jgi:hypothetical protein